MARFWTTKEIALLKEHYALKGAAWIQTRLPHRTGDAIYAKARELGLSAYWSEEDERILRKLYPIRGTQGLIALLGRDPQAIRNKANRMGLKFSGYQDRDWTESEIRELKRRYPRGGVPAMREALPNRSRMAIYIKAREIGIKSVHGPGRRTRQEAAG